MTCCHSNFIKKPPVKTCIKIILKEYTTPTKVTVIPILIVALGTILKGLKMGLEYLEIRLQHY